MLLSRRCGKCAAHGIRQHHLGYCLSGSPRALCEYASSGQDFMNAKCHCVPWLPMSHGVLLCREAPAGAADSGANTITNKLLCDDECIANLESLQTQETKTGLKYKDIVVGKGPSPPTGYQVLQHSPNLRYSNLHAQRLCAVRLPDLEVRHFWRHIQIDMQRWKAAALAFH